MPSADKGFTTFSLHKRGFTLIELMVVVSIIAILSLVGMTVYTGVQKSARDTKRKADIDAISKAYEANYNNSYQALTDNNFASGEIPDPPEGGDYFNWLAQDGSGFKVCAALDDNENTACNTPAQNCYCKASAQGTLNPSVPASSPNPNTSLAGLGGSSQSSCDSNGTLLSGLVGYWKMDESNWVNNGAGEVKDSSGGGNHGTPQNNVNITTTSGLPAIFGNAGNFDGINDYIDVGTDSSLNLTSNTLTVSAWVRTSNSGVNTIAGNTNAGVNGYEMRITNNGSLGAEGQTTNAAFNTSVGSGIADGAWHHVAITYNGSQIIYYLDGSSFGSPSNLTGNILSTSQSFKIGTAPWSPGAFMMNGQIDDVRIYNRALAPSEISLLAGQCI